MLRRLGVFICLLFVIIARANESEGIPGIVDRVDDSMTENMGNGDNFEEEALQQSESEDNMSIEQLWEERNSLIEHVEDLRRDLEYLQSEATKHAETSQELLLVNTEHEKTITHLHGKLAAAEQSCAATSSPKVADSELKNLQMKMVLFGLKNQ